MISHCIAGFVLAISARFVLAISAMAMTVKLLMMLYAEHQELWLEGTDCMLNDGSPLSLDVHRLVLQVDMAPLIPVTLHYSLSRAD